MARSNARPGYAPNPAYAQQPQQQADPWRHPLDTGDAPTAPAPQWAQQPQQFSHEPYPPGPQFAGAPGQSQPYLGGPSPQPQAYHPSAYQSDDYTQAEEAQRRGLASYSPQANHEPQAAPPSHWSPPAFDPRGADPRSPDFRGGYDLGEYAPGVAPSAAPAHAPFAHDPYAHMGARPEQASHWQQPHAPHNQQHEPSFGPGFAPHAPAYPAQHPAAAPLTDADYHAQYGQAPVGHPTAQSQTLADPRHPPVSGEEIEFEDEDDEAPPRRGRTLLVIGALVGAIFVGGGLAYTYRALSGSGKTPMLSADKTAVKTKANSASQKVPDQVPKMPDVAPKAAVASDGDITGPRRVATIPVGPDGTTQSPTPPPPMAQPPTTMAMPGLAVTMPPPMPQQVPPQVRQQPPPVTQVPPPKVTTPSPAPSRQAALPEAAVPKEPKKVVKSKESDAFSPGAAGSASAVTAPPGAKSGLGAGGNGFVAAILSTPKGKLEAMKAFADLQTKFPDVLSGKPAEVQEVNLGESKGVWYRAVVGPPGSRSAAAAVCEQLKAAGYTQCFATAY